MLKFLPFLAVSLLMFASVQADTGGEPTTNGFSDYPDATAGLYDPKWDEPKTAPPNAASTSAFPEPKKTLFTLPDFSQIGPHITDRRWSRLRTWIRGFGNWGNIENGGWTSSNVRTRSYGFSLGIDRQLGRSCLFGLMLGTDNASLKWESPQQNFDNERVKGTYGAIYYRATLDRLFLDFECGLGVNDVSYSSKSSIFQWHFNAEAGTWWEQGLGTIEPYLGLRYAGADEEWGTATKATLAFGLRYSWKTTGVYGTTVPRFYAGLLHELGDRDLFSVSSFSDSSTVYSIPGYQIAESRFFCGGGATSSLGTSLDLYLRYTAEVASDQTTHTLLCGMNWKY